MNLPNWDPSQHRALAREGAGPLLVRGRVGSGRTAVALAYARGLLGQRTLTERRILVSTPFEAAARVLAAKLGAGAHARDLAVVSIPDLCRDLVARSGRTYSPAPDEVRLGYLGDAIAVMKRRRPRGILDRSPAFFVEEIAEVIKGRALGRRDEYLALDREGRWRGLEQPVRETVWNVYEEYQMRLDAASLHDAEDLPLLALDALASTPDQGFDEVIVDDAHGASRPALLLLARLAAPADRIMLLLDEEQAYHRQGFSLKDAGIDVRRSVELQGAYRPSGDLRAFARAVLDGEAAPADGAATLLEAPSYRTQFVVAADCVRRELSAGVKPNDVAVLVASARDLLVLRRALDAADVGHVVACTIDDARGLEFASVVVVGANEGVLPRGDAGHDLTGRFRDRRRLYVAVTRARDRVVLVCEAGLRSSFMTSERGSVGVSERREDRPRNDRAGER